MTEVDRTAYYLAITICCDRYAEIYARSGHDDDLGVFILKLKGECYRGVASVPKLCRWLGYIQGCLIERRLTTVLRERDFTRPLFTPLDMREEG